MSGYYWKLKVQAPQKKGYDPSQPRVPAGDPQGGQWTSGAVGGTIEPKIPSKLKTKGAKVEFKRDIDNNMFTIHAPQGASMTALWRNAYFGGNKSPTRAELFFVEAGERRREGIGTSLARDALKIMKLNGAKTVVMYKATEEGGYLMEKLVREGDVELLQESQFGKGEYRIVK